MPTKDSFDKIPPPAPTKVTALELTFRVTENGAGNVYGGRYQFEQLDANSVPVETREGNLIPHLTAAQATQIRAFLDAMLLKAKASV